MGSRGRRVAPEQLCDHSAGNHARGPSHGGGTGNEAGS